MKTRKLVVVDENDVERVVIAEDPKHTTRGGGVEFIDYDPPNSKVIIRRISFAGDEKKEVPHKFTDR